MKSELIIATRNSPLALKQADLVRQHLLKKFPASDFKILEVITTGDKRREISLEKEGGKGLFTKEIEEALLAHEADLAVHSAKDLPTESPQGLIIAGYLPREDARDVLVLRSGVIQPKSIATGSPRRREQIRLIFPNAEFKGLRGNVTTRLEKIRQGDADATVLAAAGLNRLKIFDYEGLIFQKLSINQMVPAVGQGAIAIQCRKEDLQKFDTLFHSQTRYAVDIERTFLSALGGGCHAGFSGYYYQEKFYIYHQKIGFKNFSIAENLDTETIFTIMNKIINDNKLNE